jgi:hypothetical protein
MGIDHIVFGCPGHWYGLVSGCIVHQEEKRGATSIPLIGSKTRQFHRNLYNLEVRQQLKSCGINAI